MKVLLICGTRPEYIRLSQIIPKLDALCDLILVDTNQNYDDNLSKVFFDELNIRKPDYNLGAKGSFAEQLAIISIELEKIIDEEKPDRFLVLGDTNSSLGAIVAARKHIPVFHMEAGNRCFDEKVPEEINRRIIDHCSDILMPYTERSRQNLLAEGIHSSKIYVTGNPIKEVLDKVKRVGKPFLGKLPYLVTLHREENVDNPERLNKFVIAFGKLDAPVIWSVHPRTRKMLEGLNLNSNIELRDPMPIGEFIFMEQAARCVLTDSGTVQEECALFLKPCVTLRDTTERPETIESGSNFLAGVDKIQLGIDVMMRHHGRVPPEYLWTNVSDTTVSIVLGYYA